MRSFLEIARRCVESWIGLSRGFKSRKLYEFEGTRVSSKEPTVENSRAPHKKRRERSNHEARTVYSRIETEERRRLRQGNKRSICSCDADSDYARIKAARPWEDRSVRTILLQESAEAPSCSHLFSSFRIKNSLSPNWTKVFVFDYELGTPVKVSVQIFDQVQKGDNKPMGGVVFDVGELLGCRGNTKAKKLKNNGT